MNITDRDFALAVEALKLREYRRGLEAGLHVAEQIRDWLTEVPDTARQARTREWAEKAIAKARKS